MHNTSGAFGKQVVIKIINGEATASRYPDVSQAEYSKEQLQYSQLFADGVQYAKEILHTPAITLDLKK